MKRNRVALLCAMALIAVTSLPLLGCSGCAGSGHQAEERSGEQHSAKIAAQSTQGRPKFQEMHGVSLREVETDLSPDALNTYAFLVFAQALGQEDDNALAAAAPLLAKAQLPANIWLEGGVWLLGRKSPHAVSVMEQAMQVWPEDVSINLLYAEALMEKGQPERGVASMRSYLERYPDSLDARLELALLLVKSRQFPEAETLLNGIAEKKRTPLVEYYHARALIGMDRQSEATPYLLRATKEMPDFVEALAELAFIYEQKPDLKAARSVYEKLLKLNFSPQDVLLRLINLSLRIGQPERALKYMRQGPDNISFKLAVASMFMDSRHYLQAESLLKQIAGQENVPVEVYLMLAGLSYEQRKDLDAAVSWLDKIPSGHKGAVRGALLRAQLLSDAGREVDALTFVRKAESAFVNSPELVEVEVRLLARLKQLPQALDIAQKAVKRWPDSTDVLFLLGSLQDEIGDKKAAFNTMEQLIKLHPENFQALNYVGYTLAEEGRDLELAVKLLVKADHLAPNQAYIVDSLSWAYFKSGRNEEALAEIRRAVKLEDRVDASIWEHYGDIAARMGLTDEARDAYRKALDLKPANAETLRKRLSTL